MPDYILRPKLHGAGIIDVFEALRYDVPQFKDEILFRGFLIAFGRHVRLTIQNDSEYGQVTHWWNGQVKGSDCMFLDALQANGREKFNEEGRLRLALHLAEQTFVSLEQYLAARIHATFLESKSLLIEKNYLKQHLEIQKDSLEEELLTVPKLAPKFALSKTLVKLKRAEGIKATNLAKRAPEIKQIAPNRPITDAERKALKWSRLSEEEKQDERDKKAARRKDLRAAKKVNFYEVGIKNDRRHL